MSPSLRLLLAVTATAMLGACASAPRVSYSGLPSSTYLKRHDDSRGDRRPYAYQSQVRWSDYNRFMLEPVEIYTQPEAQFDKISGADQRQISDHMYRVFGDALANRYEPVSQPGPRTLRVQLVLTGAKPTTRFISTAMKFDLAGAPYNAIQSARGKPGALSGWIAYSVEIYDAQTNVLLAAYLETQYPNAMNVKASSGRLSAAMAGADKGAKALVDSLN
ncbi:DUF3313 domain-containing protein [Bacillus subtilis subsp. subtilis]|nr:DUF3313 domain-containing protein [Bacillus subtilis subsp. subtilis]